MEFPDHSRQLLQRLKQQRHQGFLCDCTVVVGEARFKAHKAVLASCSVYFYLFYRDQMEEKDTVRLNSDVVTAPVFSLLLKFMYEGKLELGSLPVEDVLGAAGYLHMYDIVRACKGKLRDKELCSLTAAVREGTALGCKVEERSHNKLHNKQRSRSPPDDSNTDDRQVTPAAGDCERSAPNRQKANGRLSVSPDLAGVDCRPAEVSESFSRDTGEISADIIGPMTVPPWCSQASDGTDGALDLSVKRVSGGECSPTSVPSRQQVSDSRWDANSLVKDQQGSLSGAGGRQPIGSEGWCFGTGARSPPAMFLGNKSPTPALLPQEEVLVEGKGEKGEGRADQKRHGGQLEGRKAAEGEGDGDTASSVISASRRLFPPYRRRPRQARLCTCSLCGAAFPSPRALQQHLSAHFLEREGPPGRPAQGGSAPPTCLQCGKSFSCLYTLRRHERTHSGEKPYTCGRCGKGFQYSHNLTRHALVHTREKPHACRWCERRFTQSGDLYRHVRKFHCGLDETLTEVPSLLE